MEENSGLPSSEDLPWHSCNYCSIAFLSVKELISHRRQVHLQELIRDGMKAQVTETNNNSIFVRTPSPSPSCEKPQGRVRQLSEADQERLDWQLGQIMNLNGGFFKAESGKFSGNSLAISDRDSREDEDENIPGTSRRMHASATRRSASVKRKNEPEINETAQEALNVVYSCKICSVTCDSEEEFKQHQAEHDRDDDDGFDCSYCALTFAASNHRSMHEKVHRRAGDLPKSSTPKENSSHSNGEKPRRKTRCVIKEQVKASPGQGSAGNETSLPVAKGRRTRRRLITPNKTERKIPEKRERKKKNPPGVKYACFKCRAPFPSVATFRSHYSSGQCPGETHKAVSAGANNKLPVKNAKSKQDSGKPAPPIVSSPGRLQHGCRFCPRMFSQVNYLRFHEQGHERRGQTQVTLQNGESLPDSPARNLRRVLHNSPTVASRSSSRSRGPTLSVKPGNMSVSLAQMAKTRNHKCRYCNRTFLRSGYLIFHERWHENQLRALPDSDTQMIQDIKPIITPEQLSQFMNSYQGDLMGPNEGPEAEDYSGQEPTLPCLIDGMSTSNVKSEKNSPNPKSSARNSNTNTNHDDDDDEDEDESQDYLDDSDTGPPTLVPAVPLDLTQAAAARSPLEPPRKKRRVARSRRLYPVTSADSNSSSPGDFRCTQCPRTFTTAARLTAHEKRRHLAEFREFNCSYCSRGFYSKNELKLHLRTHTGEKPYACGYCSSSFSQTSNRLTHWRHVHKQNVVTKKSAHRK